MAGFMLPARQVLVLAVICALGAFVELKPLHAAESPPHTIGEAMPGAVELVDRRTRTSSTYRNPDATFSTVLSTTSEHFRGEDGRWRKISTNLVPSADAGYAWENEANRFKIKFKPTATDRYLRIEVAGKQLDFSLEGSSGKRAKSKQRGVDYTDAVGSVDLRYDMFADGVKETLVLPDAKARTHYRFFLDAPSGAPLRFVKRENGAVAFFMDPQLDPVFELAPLVVKDSAPAKAADGVMPAAPYARPSTDAARMKVVKIGKRLAIDVDLDKAWLSAPERRFPVLLDPTIVIQPPTQNNEFEVDCAANPCTSVMSRGAVDEQWIGAYSSGPSAYRPAAQFDLSAIPANVEITAASLGFYFAGYVYATPNALTLEMHKVTSAWVDGTSGVSYGPKVSELVLPASSSPSWLAWDAKAPVQEWLASGGNNGLIVRNAAERTAGSGAAMVYSKYWAGYTGNATLAPKLEVTYKGDEVELNAPQTLHSNGAELEWTRYAGVATFSKYEVHRSESASFTPSDATLVATIGDIAITSYRDTTAAPSKSFTYRIVANTRSVVSNARTVTTPGPGLAKKTLQPGPDAGAETYIATTSGSTSCVNYGAEDRMQVGTTSTSTYRGLVSFDLRDVPAGATVTSAVMSLWHPDTISATTLRTYRVTSDWLEGTGSAQCTGNGATWTERQSGVSWTSAGGDYAAAQVAEKVHVSPDVAGWDDYDVKSAAQTWVNGDAPNLGLVVRRDDESLTSPKLIAYFTGDYLGGATLRPKLVLEYSDASTPSAPIVSVAAPASNAQVQSTVEVSASASDDGRVEMVEFLLDDVVKTTDTTAPYAWSWASSTAANGDHWLKARATDEAGNVTTSAAVRVVVANSSPPATSITSPDGSYSGIVKADNPAGYWRLAETAGTSAADSSGNNRNGTYASMFTLAQPSLLTGDANTAAKLRNGTDGKVTFGGFSGQLGGNISVEAWVDYAALGAAGRNRVVARNWGSSGGWLLSVYESGGAQRAEFAINKSGVITTANAVVTPGKLHLVGVYDGGAARLYVNGTQAASASVSAVTFNTTASPIAGATLSNDITVDEIALSGTALSAAQVQKHRDAGLGLPAVTVAGDVTVSASASDDGGVSKVEFYADEIRFAEDTTTPYSAVWQTLDAVQPAYDGAHTLTTKAYDASGQVTTSSPVNVIVANTTGTKYRAEITSTPAPIAADFDPAAPTQDKQGLDVTVKNTSATTWSPTDVALRYRWVSPDETPVYTESPDVALSASVAPGATQTVTVLADPPVLPDGVNRAQYILRVDLVDKTNGSFFAAKGNKPLENPVIVNKELVRGALGLERYYHYAGEELGAGMQHLVNVANGNSVVRWTPFEAPGRGLSTVVDLTYNALEKKCDCPAGNNWSLSISTLTRFGNPIDVHPNNADTIGGRSNKYIELTDGDGTTHRFSSTDGVTYQEPAGVHLYLRRYSTTDAQRKWALTRPDRVTFFYDADGYPTFVRDRNGNEIAFTLETTPSGEDPGGPKKRVTKVSDAGGRSFDLDYYSKAEAKKAHVRGKIQRISDHSGSALDFEYYEDGNLLRIVQRGGAKADGSLLADRSFVFTYTTSNGDGPAIPLAADRVDPNVRTSNQSTRLYSARDPRGNETTFAYLGSGSGEDRWKLSSRSDRAGKATTFAYDTATRTTTETRPLARVWSYAYDVDGKLVTLTNPKSEQTTLDWSADRHVTKVTQPTGEFTEYAYNQNGYLTDEWDELRNQTKLEYQDLAVDANDTKLRISQLAKKTDPKGTATTGVPNDYQWTFDYDSNGNLLTATDPEGFASTQTYNGNGTVATSTDANNRTTTLVAYDANGLPTEIRDAKAQTTRLAYDADGLLRSVQDPLHQSDTGVVEREFKAVFEYDSFHRLGRQSAPKSTALERGKLIWSGVDYDPNDNIVSSLAPDYAPGGGDKTTIGYDPMDRQTLVTGPDTSVDTAGERTQLEYDEAGRLLRVTAPKGVATPAVADDFVSEYTYDLLDRVVTEARKAGTDALRTHFCYDLAGDLRWLIAPKASLATAPTDCSATPPAHTARAAYDDAHRLLTVTDPLGRSRTVGYDVNGAVTTSSDEDGTQQTRTYNQRGQLIKAVQAFDKDANNVTTRALTTVIEYDPVGNAKREISPRAWDASADKVIFSDYVTEYSYDELGRVTRVALPTDATTIPAYVHRSYDANGNLTMTSLPTAKADLVVTPLAAEEKTLVSYFDTAWVESTNDPANPKAHFDYTAEGWQASRTPEKVGAPGELDTTQQMLWEYFADGQQKRQTDRKGLGSTYTYDANNNLVAAEEGRGVVDASESAFDVEAVYDGFDRQTKVRQKRKTGENWTFTSSAYDPNGSVSVREDDGVETTAGALVTAAQRNEFVYDDADQLTTHTDFGRLTGTTDDRRITSGYSPQGWEQSQLVERSDGAGGWTALQRTDSSYYASGDLKTLVTTNGAGSILETHTLSYEDTLGRYLNGNRARDVFRLLGPDLGQPCRTSDCTTTYTFDAQERLVEEKLERAGAPVVSKYQLDPAGNIEKEWLDGVLKSTSEYTGTQLSKLTAGASVSNFFYDSDGNLDCQTSGTIVDSTDCNTPAGGTPSTRLAGDYSYDHLNRLAAFRGYTSGTLNTTSGYTADAFDRVVSQTDTPTGSTAKKTLFSYLGLSGEVTDERHETAAVLQTTKSYSYDAFGRRTGMSDNPVSGTSAAYTFGRNVHGDVSLLVNAAGQAKAAYGYRAYGSEDELSQGDTKTSPLNPFRFNDKRWDSGSGSLDMGARRFSPDLGRFIQRDMYADALDDLDLSTDPLTGNRYSFAGGNPISFIESDGHQAGPISGIVGAGSNICVRWSTLCGMSFNFPKFVFGEVREDRRGKYAVGVHWTTAPYRDIYAALQKLKRVQVQPFTEEDPRGVYKAQVTIRGTSKRGISTVFPRKWRLFRTLDEINYALTPPSRGRRGGLTAIKPITQWNRREGRYEIVGIKYLGWTRGDRCSRIRVVGIAPLRGRDKNTLATVYPIYAPHRCRE